MCQKTALTAALATLVSTTLISAAGASDENAPRQQRTKQLQGGVQDTRLMVQAALRQIKQSNDNLNRDILIMANEATRHITPAPMSPNAIGGMVLPPITFNNVSLGPLPPRPQVVHGVLSEINAEVRHLQQDERGINEAICGLGNEQATVYWNDIVRTTADIIDTYRALEPAALSQQPQAKLLGPPTVHLYDATNHVNVVWKQLQETLAKTGTQLSETSGRRF